MIASSVVAFLKQWFMFFFIFFV